MTKIIEVRNLSKQYRIHRAHSLEIQRDDAIGVNVESVKSLARTSSAVSSESFWALKNVSFEIEQGESLGIIGRNGAGKSTLLKILSRVTAPTSGRVALRGRVSSLLEVGVGFHPDLSGRENVYLNGTIHGLRKWQIDRKFDEIVAFSEIENFIDEPVKHYSSGMYVRLAFSVAAHLEPDIVLIDEVLAVGDVAFQKKCFEKIKKIVAEGKTILFISHSMTVVRALCKHTIMLEDGHIVSQGDVAETTQFYLGQFSQESTGFSDLSPERKVSRHGNQKVFFKEIELVSMEGKRNAHFKFGEPFNVRLTIASESIVENAVFGFSFISLEGLEIQGSAAHDAKISCDLKKGEQRFECIINPMPLVPSHYVIRGAVFKEEQVFDHVYEMIAFEILKERFDESKTPSGHYVGHVYVPYNWTRLND